MATPESEAFIEKDASISVEESNGIDPHNLSDKSVSDMEHATDGDGFVAAASSPGIITHDEVEDDTNSIEEATSRQAEAPASKSHEEITPVNSSDAHEALPSLVTNDNDVISDPPADTNQTILSGDTNSPEPVELEGTHISSVDGLSKGDNQLKDADLKPELVSDSKNDLESLKIELGSEQKENPERSTGVSAVKVQEQLDEVMYVHLLAWLVSSRKVFCSFLFKVFINHISFFLRHKDC